MLIKKDKPSKMMRRTYISRYLHVNHRKNRLNTQNITLYNSRLQPTKINSSWINSKAIHGSPTEFKKEKWLDISPCVQERTGNLAI